VPKSVPFVFVQMIAFEPDVAQSPEISEAAGAVPSRKSPVPADVEFKPPLARGTGEAIKAIAASAPLVEGFCP
jgi:hypothetical protein